MSNLTKHDVVHTKLENEKFDFLVFCKTCGWEARGFDAMPPSAEDLEKDHVAAKLGFSPGSEDLKVGPDLFTPPSPPFPPPSAESPSSTQAAGAKSSGGSASTKSESHKKGESY